MAILDATLIGYDGEIDAIQWARLNAIPERGFVSDNDWRVDSIDGQRRVIVGPGTNRHAGVLASTDQAVQLDVPAPASGQGRWYCVVARRSWASKSLDFALVAGPVTTTQVPQAPPLLPPSLSNSPGVETDLHLAWAWASSALPGVLTWDWRHDRPRPFEGRKGSGGGSEEWTGSDPIFGRSLYSIIGGRVSVEQLLTVQANGDRVGAQLKRPFRAAAGVPEFSQEGRGGIRRPGGVAYLFGLTAGRAGSTVDEIRFDLMSTTASIVGQTNIANQGPFNGWRAGDYLYLKYDYVPVWPLTPTP